jgi:hypothetical protein
MPVEHPARSVCLARQALEDYVLSDHVPAILIGEHLLIIFGQLMVRRTLSSHMPSSFGSKPIGSAIPPTYRKICNVTYTDE